MGKKIKWQRMLELKKLDVWPFQFRFMLVDPWGEHGALCAGEQEIDHFDGLTPRSKDCGFLMFSTNKVFAQLVEPLDE